MKTSKSVCGKPKEKKCSKKRSSAKIEKTEAVVLSKQECMKLKWELRGFRLKHARERGIEPFKVFHDRTMFDMMERLPANEQELQQCWGIKEARCRLIGEELLEIIERYSKKK